MSDQSNDDANNAARLLFDMHRRQQQQLSQQPQPPPPPMAASSNGATTSIRPLGQPTPGQNTVSWADVNQGVPFTPHVARPFYQQVSSNVTNSFVGWTPMQQQAALYQRGMTHSTQQMTQGIMSTPGLASMYTSALPSTQQRSSQQFQPSGIASNPQVVNQWTPQQQHGIYPNQLFGSNASSQPLAPKPPPPPQVVPPQYCAGLADERIDIFAQSNLEYCANHFGRLHNKWRSQMCLFVAPNDPETRKADGWKERLGLLHCSHCLAVKRNLYRHIKRLDEAAKTSDSTNKLILPPSATIKERLIMDFRSKLDSFDTRGEAETAFKNDEAVLEAMLVLAGRGDADFTVEHDLVTLRVLVCKSSVNCKQILIAKARSDNADHCETCRSTKKNAARSTARQQDVAVRIDPSSKVPITSLNSDERKKRMNNSRTVKKKDKRIIIRLEKEINSLRRNLADLTVHLDGSQGNAHLETSADGLREESRRDLDSEGRAEADHQTFMSDMTTVFEHISSNPKEFKDVASLLVNLMKEGVDRETKTNDYEFAENDVTEMVDFIMEQMSNCAKTLAGKSRQCRYSPLTLQLAYAMHSRSPSAFCEFRSLSPLFMPGPRRLRGVKQINKVTDGRDVKVYQLRAAARGASRKSENGYLMADEMKLKHGVLWNAMTGKAVGLADDMLDVNSVMKRILSDEGDAVQPAKYVNCWRYIAIQGKSTEGWMCGFFFNDGTLNGATLLRQFDHVTLSCESIGSKVRGLVLDAGGGNNKFTCLLRDNAKFNDDVYWLDEEHCYTRNIFDPKRRIYFWFCMTHGLKAMRNQLLASQQNGSKSFVDRYGTNFGWAYVVKLNHYLDNENTPELKRNVRLNDKAANPTNYRKMSVSLAKIIFEHKTLSYGQEKLCQALGITPQCLEVEVQRRLVNNPPIRLGDENGHNTNRSHGYHLEKAKYIYELILKCEKAGDKSPLIEANNKAALTPVVPSTPLPAEDYSFDDLTEEEIALAERMDADGIIDLIQESIPPPPPSTTTPQPPTQAHVELAPQSQYNVIPQETHCDASTLVYMATMNAVYVDMILNKSEKFNKDNYEQYTQYLKNIMTYFHEMKLAQLERRTRGDKKWDVQFLDIITWKNFRVAVCGFVYFAGHMLHELPDEVDGFSYIAML